MNKFLFFPAALVVLFFLLSPLTWSFITSTGRFLIRPIDFVAILMIILTFGTGQVRLSKKAFRYVLLFLILLIWLLINSIVTNETLATITVGKITFYLLASISAASWIQRLNFKIPNGLFLGLTIALVIWIVGTSPEVFGAFSNINTNLITNPQRVFNNFWHDIFQINLFGPVGTLIVKGVSFRNTAALGFLSIALLIYGVVKPGVISNILFYIFIGIALSTLSRTAILCALLFIFLIMITINSFKSRVAFLAIVILFAGFTYNSVFSDVVGNRFAASGNRVAYFIEGVELLGENPIWGLGSDAKIEGVSGTDKTVHNVSLALGTQFGVIALIASASILLANFFALIHFSKGWIQSITPRERQLYTVFIVAAFIITARPNLSASSQNFYSYSEWACFSLVLAGLSLKTSVRKVRPRRRRVR